MDVVELNCVSLRYTFAVAPAPADGYARVTEVGDVVVRDLIVAAVANPHRHAAGEDVAAGLNDVVVHDAVARAVGVGRFLVLPAFADARAARAHVVQGLAVQPA